MLAPLAIALALGGQSPPAARVVTGTLLDPGGLPVAAADVSLRCSTSDSSAVTDVRGAFVLRLERDDHACRLRVSVSGFAPLEQQLDALARGAIIVHLRLRPHEEHLTIRGELDNFPSPLATSVDGALVREFVGDTDSILDYARAVAGRSNDSARVVVDGVRRSTLPAGTRIDRVTVNADPYSASLGGLDGARIDVETAPLTRLWSYTGTVAPGAIAGRHPLGAGHQMQTRAASAGVAGPLPRAGFAWAAGVNHTRREQEQPLLASFTSPAGAANTVSTRDRLTHVFGIAAYEATTTRATIDVAIEDARMTGIGAGALVAPEAATDDGARTIETHASVRRMVRSVVVKSSAMVAVSTRDALARSLERGTSVSGGAVEGGAAVTSEKWRRARSSWILRADGRSRGKYWHAGVEFNSSHARELWVPNVKGITYMAPAGGGATIPVALLLDIGAGQADVRMRKAAAHAEVQWLRTTAATLNSGVRVDLVTGDAPVFQPRVSASVRIAGGRVTAGAGRFADDWEAETLLPLHARSAPGIEHVAFDGAGVGVAGVLRETAVSDISRQRQTVASIGMNRAFGGIDFSGEYRWSLSTAVPSLERALTAGGWVERFGSAGRQRQQEVRSRVRVGPQARSLIAHYTWRRGRETTDGWYGSPVSAADLGRWVPSAGVPGHDGAVVLSMRTRAGTSLSAVGSVTTGRPVDLVFAPRTFADVLTAPRRPAGRNTGTGPGYASVSVYASQRLSLPLTRLRGRLGFQVVNVLNRRNLLAPVTVVDSPFYGKATSAAPGRALSAWFALETR